MLQCAVCGAWKSDSAFRFMSHKGRWDTWCRDCRLAYNHRWYEINRVRHIANVRASAKRWLHAQRRIVERLKSEPCVDCGVRYPSYVMDFDHVDGEKVGNISAMRGRASETRLLEEIAKCDLVCSNCHRERTHQRRAKLVLDKQSHVA